MQNKFVVMSVVADNLSQILFWDVDSSQIDLEKESAFIIQRVFEMGSWSDWCFIKSYYGLEKIVSISKTIRDLNPKAVSYLCCIYGAKKEDFRCYNIKR